MTDSSVTGVNRRSIALEESKSNENDLDTIEDGEFPQHFHLIVEQIMKRIIACGLVLLTILFTLGANEDKPRGVFSSLQIGQKVNLKEEVQGFTITFFDEKEFSQSHKVLEIGKDFVVLESVSGFETTIPVYAVKSVVKMKGS